MDSKPQRTSKLSLKFSLNRQVKKGLPASLNIVCSYKRKRISIARALTPVLTAEEFCLFTPSGELKQPLPDTELTQDRIDKAAMTMDENRQFWLATIGKYLDGHAWETANAESLLRFAWEQKHPEAI